MSENNVVLPDDPRNFQSAAVPQMRTFRKARDVIKSKLIQANAEAANLDFEDFEVVVDAANHQFTLSLKENHVNRYELARPITFTYNDIDFNALFTGSNYLNFGTAYDESKLDEVYAALGGKDNNPWYNFEYNESTQVLTVTVKPQNTSVTFMEDDATPVTVLFPGKTINVEFKDDAIDLSTKFTATELSVVLDDLLEPSGAEL